MKGLATLGTNPARNGAKRKVPMRKVALKIGIRAVIVNKALDRLVRVMSNVIRPGTVATCCKPSSGAGVA